MSRVIGVIGTGRMGSALVRGLVNTGTPAGDIVVFDTSGEAASALASELGVSIASGNAELVSRADVVVLAVKPQNADSVLGEIAGEVDGTRLVVSIAAGVTTKSLEKKLSSGCRVVRVMPNTPLRIGKGATAYCSGSAATKEDADFVGEIFSKFGVVVEVEEKLMDVVTGLSGSGPAFIYSVIEALAEGGVRKGLDRDTSLKLAAQTVLGAASMVIETGGDPAALRDEVTSPGGTTIEGLKTLEDGGLRQCLIDAVIAASERSVELGKGKK